MTEKIATTEVSSRRLLKRLRDVMLQDTAIQDKLKSIVSVVASEMGTPVCSFYLLQPGDILELYATYGLNPKSIHETKLRTGEGLIGEVAIQKKALSFEDAQNHQAQGDGEDEGQLPLFSVLPLLDLEGSQPADGHHGQQQEEVPGAAPAVEDHGKDQHGDVFRPGGLENDL